MNIIKKSMITLFVSGLLVAGSNAAYAEEAAKVTAPAAAPAAQNVTDVLVKHLDQALATSAQSDFQNATIHLKAARSEAAEMSGNALEVHKGVAEINNAMKAAKLGLPEKATEAINKAIKIFKAL